MTPHKSILHFSLMTALLATGCAAHSVDRRAAELTQVQVVSYGQDQGGEFCRDFNLTALQAKWFLSRAKVLNAEQLHDGFDLLPCWVKGTAQSRRGALQWEIRAGGTARLISANGQVDLLGCNDCDALLSGQSPASK